MALKQDMSKAYDKVKWAFLQDMMLRMGFESSWVDFIMQCVSTTSYSISINGERGSLFKLERGLRQGDPLSPYLFLICSEGLSSLMRLTKEEDGTIFFGETTEISVNVLEEILKEYEVRYGQCVNFDKSLLFFSSNVTEMLSKECHKG
ncbi:reverse transcriptase [Gossypium australe]|uniref:Reverse transcriptase n=1 Tax=Gossypium australe TaxID=47621 RepID=A0A5B6WMF7_9ROSI|nr:reverse transcriptase [Gossypium australe]